MGLKVTNVEKVYGSKKAVDNISFELANPGVFGLLGTNGAGKTTTIRMILGIITKDTGEISWNGNEVKRKHVNFGYMPEERGLYPKSKIYDQLCYFAELKGMNKASADKAIHYWLDKLKMSEYINMPAEKLSKGNQQKIQFIISVMHDPELIILDEPFSGLDPVNAEQLKNVILELVDKKKYIIMSSHQMTSIEEFCSEVVILNHGKTVLKGNLKEIKDSYPAKTIEVNCKSNIDDLINQVGLTINSNINNNYVLMIKEKEQAGKLFKLLSDNGIEVTKFEVKKPSLNDIFIEKVGGQE